MQVEKLYSQLKGLNGFFFLQEKTEHKKKYWAQNKNKRTNKQTERWLFNHEQQKFNVDSVLKQLKCLKNFAPKDASIINPTVFMYIYCLSLSLPNVVSSVTAVCSPWYSLICAFPCLSLTFGLSWTFCYFSTILKAHFITSPYILSSGCCFPHSYTCLILDNVLC